MDQKEVAHRIAVGQKIALIDTEEFENMIADAAMKFFEGPEAPTLSEDEKAALFVNVLSKHAAIMGVHSGIITFGSFIMVCENHWMIECGCAECKKNLKERGFN